MTSYLTIQELQAQLPDLLYRLNPGDEIFIIDKSLLVARLVLSPPTPIQRDRKLGAMAGSVLYMAPDFDAPLENF